MMFRKLLFLIIITTTPLIVISQQFPKYYQSNIIEVYDSNNALFVNPFGGGLKFPVFASFHLNSDNKADLVILDKVDNRILTFINEGNMKYTYRPEFERFFPDSLVSFLVFKDYDNDGKNDLFTYSNVSGAGISVYKNTSNQIDGIRFEMASEQLITYDWGNYQFSYNLPLFQVDMPAIIDMDEDGDLDMLIFDELGGSWLKLYNNMSVELCGNANALLFTSIDHYWGEFYESDNTNEVTLNQKYNWGYRYYKQNYDSLKAIWDIDSICNPDIGLKPDRIKESNYRTPKRHIGSTILAEDMDDDDDIDLLVGDIGYSGVLMLENGKSDSNLAFNKIISNNLHFPLSSKEVDIPQMPASYYIDIDLDGVKDMVFAPYDMDEIDTFKSLNQIWLYLNKGSNNNLDLKYESNNFLQHEMIDLGGATSPAFCDYDHDGDQDLFVISKGDFHQTYYQADQLYLFENIGNGDNAIFKMINNDYLSLSTYKYRGLKPAFADVDSDGDQDLFFGRINGKLMYFENKAASGQVASFQLQTIDYQSIDVGDYSAPAFADLNNDSLVDMIIGEKRGVIYYYQNTGTTSNPVFTLTSSKLGNIDFPSSEVFLSPVLGDIDSNGAIDLILGAQVFELFYQYTGGKLYFYPDISNDLTATFELKDSILLDSESKQPLIRSVGHNVSPAIAKLDGDQFPDIICGGKRGGLTLFNTNHSLFTVITANKELTICPGDSITLHAGAGFDKYEWNTGETSASVTVDSAFTYSCKVTKGIVSYTAYITINVHSGILDAEFDYDIDERKVDFSLKNLQIKSVHWDFGDGAYTLDENNPSHTYTQQGTYVVCMSVKDVCGGIDKECKSIFVQSSVNEIKEFGIKLYPNPFSNYLMLESSEINIDGFEVILTDMLGKVNFRKILNQNSLQYLDLSEIPSGMYIVQVLNKEKQEKSYKRILKY